MNLPVSFATMTPSASWFEKLLRVRLAWEMNTRYGGFTALLTKPTVLSTTRISFARRRRPGSLLASRAAFTVLAVAACTTPFSAGVCVYSTCTPRIVACSRSTTLMVGAYSTSPEADSTPLFTATL